MVEVDQIIVGYCRDLGDNKCAATGSVTLIKDQGKNILVDCGDPWNGDQIKEGLEKNNLDPDQIDYLIITHGHSDHCGNMSMFKNSTILMAEGVAKCANNEYTCYDVENSYQISENVDVLYMDGHTDIDLAIIAKNTDKGTIVVAGDLIEDKNDRETNSWRFVSKYPERQELSRKRIFEIGDYIIPGHGEGFKKVSCIPHPLHTQTHL
ncbi:hypothetical protein WR25_14525 [Diploscapter pachys]|uniref:Metallo-beta-lactamase domain-containing protein n=1 Tax=Diploscapter pachys TaxID=2018661 RepID=A0A2A2JU38_9BILA|nr:hypothetical protein WR25_14525 [Diploscapter pachys]